MAFVPGYVKGNALYGVWSVSQVFVDKAWSNKADPNDDGAFLVVHKRNSTSSIQSVTGGEHLATGDSYGQPV